MRLGNGLAVMSATILHNPDSQEALQKDDASFVLVAFVYAETQVLLQTNGESFAGDLAGALETLYESPFYGIPPAFGIIIDSPPRTDDFPGADSGANLSQELTKQVRDIILGFADMKASEHGTTPAQEATLFYLGSVPMDSEKQAAQEADDFCAGSGIVLPFR